MYERKLSSVRDSNESKAKRSRDRKIVSVESVRETSFKHLDLTTEILPSLNFPVT